MKKLTSEEFKINDALLAMLPHNLFKPYVCQIMYFLHQGKMGRNEIVEKLGSGTNERNVDKAIDHLEAIKWIVKVTVHSVSKKADCCLTPLGTTKMPMIELLIQFLMIAEAERVLLKNSKPVII